MSMSIPAHVRPSLLRWAREQAGYDRAAVAEKLKVPGEHLAAWEDEAANQERPTVAQARRLAELYKRPLAVFFLSEPPRGFDVLREYRRLHGVAPGSESPELRYALRMADLRRDVLLDLASEIGEPVPRLEGQASVREDPEEVGARLRSYLDVPVDRQIAWRSSHEALAGWRGSVENRGVLVLQVPGVRLDEMRAASIPKDPLPVILLNTKDAAPQGRIFSLLHEVTHLWLLRGGQEVSEEERGRPLGEQPTEIFSNRVAGATLLPADSFRREQRAIRDILRAGPDDLRDLKALAHRYSVSTEVVARRLLTLEMISQDRYRRIRALLQESVPRPPPDEVRIPIEIKVLSQLGRWYTSALLRAYQGEMLTGSRLSDYLGIKLKYVPKIESELRGRVFGRVPEPEFA